jgi:DNA-binding GntR family transcriptional regulator
VARRPSTGRYRLASQILDLVCKDRFESGYHLREQQLSQALGVSRTPVRAALDLLAEIGVVEARRNQGFVLTASYSALEDIRLEPPPTPNQDLYDRIIGDRLAGAIPNFLAQSDIARRYGADRLVVEHTLLQLADHGIIVRNKGRGWSFQPTLDSHGALRASYEFRLVIEPAGFLFGSFQPDRSRLEQARRRHEALVVQAELTEATASQIFAADADFHEMMAAFSGNAFLLQAVEQQNRLRRVLEFGGYFNRRRIRDWCQEHLAIIDAVTDNAREKAGQLMRVHLTNAWQMADHISLAASEVRTSRFEPNRDKT